MSVIWKYDIGVLPMASVEMPVGARVVRVGKQDNSPMLWVLCDPTAELERRWFLHVLTGPEFDSDGMHYHGSYELNLVGGPFVGHVFEQVGS